MRPYTRLNGTWTYIYRAIDQYGQVVDAISPRAGMPRQRKPSLSARLTKPACGRTASRPGTLWVKAKCYPPALRTVLPNVEHRTSKYLNNGLERDHGHLKQRLYPMRGFKQAAAADLLTRGHAFVQNLRNGFCTLTATVPRQLRLVTAWAQLTQAI